MVCIGARRRLIYGCALKMEAVSRSMTAQALAFGWCIFRNSIQVRKRVGRSDMGPFLGPAARTPLAAHATNHRLAEGAGIASRRAALTEHIEKADRRTGRPGINYPCQLPSSVCLALGSTGDEWFSG